jgi:hypothetical protein
VVDNGIIYLCAAKPDFGKQQPYNFLAEVVIFSLQTLYQACLSVCTIKYMLQYYNMEIRNAGSHKLFIKPASVFITRTLY